MVPVPSARAASTRALLVMDLEPGMATRARTGPVAAGAAQRPACGPLCSIQVSLVRRVGRAAHPVRWPVSVAAQVWHAGFWLWKVHSVHPPVFFATPR